MYAEITRFGAAAAGRLQERLQRGAALVRRLLLGRLITSLAAALGLAQLGVLHWVLVLGGGSPLPGLPLVMAGLVLIAGNVAAVPLIHRARRRRDRLGRVVRTYVHAAVGTLLVGGSVAAAWALFLPARLALGFDAALTAFRVTSPLLVVGVAATVAWGFTRGQSRITTSRVRVPLPGLDPRLDGLRVVQISDLHIGNGLEGRRLSRMVALVNATEPDVIAVTGDIFDFDPAFVEGGAKRLDALRARYGVFAVLGNHDAYVGADFVAEALARHAPGIRVLRDEIARLSTPAPLYVAGLEDRGCRWFERALRAPELEALAAQRPDDGPVVLLAHQPEVFEHAAELRFPLVLSGHTHGGQIALPTPGYGWNLARVMTPLTRGLYHRDATTLYVNRGLGVGGPPVRINCPREIATIELVAQPATGDGPA